MEKNHRMDLITKLVRRQYSDHSDPGTVREAVREAVSILVQDLYCDLKYDPDLLNETLMAYGWTPDDVEALGVSGIFDN